MDEEAAIAAKKKKRVNTKLAHLTEAQKRSRKINRNANRDGVRKEKTLPDCTTRLLELAN
jgi:hypothetical protein